MSRPERIPPRRVVLHAIEHHIRPGALDVVRVADFPPLSAVVPVDDRYEVHDMDLRRTLAAAAVHLRDDEEPDRVHRMASKFRSLVAAMDRAGMGYEYRRLMGESIEEALR